MCVVVMEVETNSDVVMNSVDEADCGERNEYDQ